MNIPLGDSIFMNKQRIVPALEVLMHHKCFAHFGEKNMKNW